MFVETNMPYELGELRVPNALKASFLRCKFMSTCVHISHIGGSSLLCFEKIETHF